MIRLSVNINKIATLRNARGGDVPSVLDAARSAEAFGAQGITVHPRPDERHIRYQDVRDLKKVVRTELNIEGYPDPRFLDLVREVRPDQLTLVPDKPGQLTSDHGWDTLGEELFLKDVIQEIRPHVGRVSLFIDPRIGMAQGAVRCGAERVELYTEAYARAHAAGEGQSILEIYRTAASEAKACGLGVNAGHDLDLDNLGPFIRAIPFLDEVSIGHALVSRALYMGLENTIQAFLRVLGRDEA